MHDIVHHTISFFEHQKLLVFVTSCKLKLPYFLLLNKAYCIKATVRLTYLVVVSSSRSIAMLRCFTVSVGAVYNDSSVSVVGFEEQ